MSKKMFWGLSILIVIFIAGVVFWLIDDHAERKQLKRDLAEVKELERHMNQQPSVDNKPPRLAREGYKWEWHGDHWDEMPIAQNEAQHETPETDVRQSKPIQHPSVVNKNNGEYVDIDYSVFDKPEELIAKVGSILLNREKYSREEYDRAGQEALILSDKISNGYYGEGEYRDNLIELKNKTYGDALLKRSFGMSREELRAMVRGKIPPLVIPIDPAVLDNVDGGDK